MPDIPFYQPIMVFAPPGPIASVAGGPGYYFGTQSPENVQAADPGSIYSGEDGTLWLKKLSTGATGWEEVGVGDPADTTLRMDYLTTIGLGYAILQIGGTFANPDSSVQILEANFGNTGVPGLITAETKLKMDRLLVTEQAGVTPISVNALYDRQLAGIGGDGSANLTGVAEYSTDLGTFTNDQAGDIVSLPNNENIKETIRQLGISVDNISTSTTTIVPTYADLPALTDPPTKTGDFSYVEDASGDPSTSIPAGTAALYIADMDPGNEVWILIQVFSGGAGGKSNLDFDAADDTTATNNTINITNVGDTDGTPATLVLVNKGTSKAGLMSPGDKTRLDDTESFVDPSFVPVTVAPNTNYTVVHNLNTENHDVRIIRDSDKKVIEAEVTLGATQDVIGFSLPTAETFTYYGTKVSV